MAEHLTEEEQIETIKRWWRENWLSVVVPIALAICAYTGWNFWADYKTHQAREASAVYTELVGILEESSFASPMDDEKKSRARELITQLDAYKGSLYSDLGDFIAARLAVEAEDLAEAEKRLRGVMNGGANEAIRDTARARLARVLVSQGETEQALALLEGAKGVPAFLAMYAEIRGDAYVAQSKLADANTAYQEAITQLPADQFARRSLIQFKLDSTKVASVVDAEPATEPAAGSVGDTSVDATADEVEES